MKVVSWLKTLLISACVLVFALVFCLNSRFVAREGLWLYLLCAVVSVLALVFAVKKLTLSMKTMALLIGLMSFLLHLTFALITRPAPVSDFALLYRAAEQVAAGDTSFQNLPYFQHWAYQTGFVAYEAVIVKLFGPLAQTVLMALNCLYLAGTNVLICLITKKLTGDARPALFAGVLYLLYPAPYFLAPVLTNQHLSTCLMLIGVYAVLCVTTRTRLLPFCAGVLIGLGHIFYPLGIVVVGALCLYFGLCFLADVKKGTLRAAGLWLLRGGCVVVSYFVVFLLASNLVVLLGLNANGLRNTEPLWKFVTGLDTSTDGRYSSESAAAMFGEPNRARRQEIARELIRQSAPDSFGAWGTLFYRKIDTLWGGYESTAWTFGNDATQNKSPAWRDRWQPWVERLKKADKAYASMLWLLALLGTASVLRKKQWKNGGVCLIVLVFLLYFGAHLLIEIQVRYRYFAMPFVCILAALPLLTLWGVPDWLRTKFIPISERQGG